MDEQALPELVVRGHEGLLNGVACALPPGRTLVVGRSRSCDISLRRTDAFREHDDQLELLHSPEFRRVSRVHCEISYRSDGIVEVLDLSANGTLVDGTRVEGSARLDPSDGPVLLVLCDPMHGRLELTVAQTTQSTPAQTTPAQTTPTQTTPAQNA